MMLYFFMLPTSLVRMEDGFCEASGLEQREAQNDRVRCHREPVSYTHLDVYKRQATWSIKLEAEP